MSNLDEKTELKKYLLGNLKEVEAIEKRILADEDYFQELEMVEEELIQDFADGNLSASEKALFEQNFVLTPERANKLSFAKNLRTYIDKNPERISKPKKNGLIDSLRAFFSSPIPVGFAVLLIAGIAGYFVWNQYYRESEILASLNKVYKNERPTEGRITGFDYAPKTEGTRGSNDKTENLDLVSAKARATEAVLKNQTAENYHELGRVYLAEKNFDEAIKNFEKGIKKNPNIARLHNDLGLALLEKSNQKEEGRLELFAKANEEFSKAIELDKTLLEAYFNQALGIDTQKVLPNQTKEAWENYIKLDSTSKWADEARERLKRLEENKPISKTKEEILQDFLTAKEANDDEKAWQVLSRNREMITGKLIPQQLAFLFVDSKSNRNEVKAKKALDALVYVGKLEEIKSGDMFWHDLAKYYANVYGNEIAELKNAHVLLLNAHLAYKSGNYVEAQKLFASSKKSFDKSKNYTESYLCDYWIGSSFFYLSQIGKNQLIFESLASICEKENYKWLLSLSYARFRNSFSSTNQVSKALKYAKKSLALAIQIQDEVGIQKISSQIAEEYQTTGRFEESIRYLNILLKYNQEGLKWLDYETLSTVFYKQKFNETAFLYAKEGLGKAIENDSAINQQLSNINLATISASQNKHSEAEDYIRQSISIAESFSDSSNKEKSLAYSKLQLANIKRRSNKFDESLIYYSESIKFYETSEFSLDKYEAYKGKLISLFALKREVEFKQELLKTIELLEKYRFNISEEQNRNSFFNDEQDIYDIAIEQALEESDYTQAFNYSEKSRSRSLLDLQNSNTEISANEKIPEVTFSSNIVEPLNFEQIQREIPEDVQLLEFTVLKDKVLIWLITKDRFEVTKNDISSETLQTIVFDYVNLIVKNEDEAEQKYLSNKLFEILIRPINAKLEKDKEIFIVPDKFLFRLPFAAISSESTYFIEEYKISLAPSASMFILCSRKANQFNDKTPERLLSIGNPEFRQDLFEDLVPLPSAKQEATEIANFYEKPFVFLGKDATKHSLKKNLKKANIFHFAGHYLVDETSQMLSGLVLSGTNYENSNFANYEILSDKLAHTNLIILSACQSGIERYYNGEGMIGASRSFLAAGVPLVIASQWKVDSQATAMLMIDFHRIRKVEKRTTVAALRQAQLAMLKSAKHKQPYYWASFTTFGGDAQF